MIRILIALTIALASIANAKEQIPGSDTMAGAMTDAVIAAGLSNEIDYVGGGSSTGEKALIANEVGMTAMSRQLKPEAQTQLQTQGAAAIEHVIALDGVALWVNAQNKIAGLDFATITKIYNCEYTTWQQIAGSGRTGAINAYRRNDQSGTTDTFKNLIGIKTFGACVKVLAETVDIAEKTASDVNAIGFSGMSAAKTGNRALAIAKSGTSFVAPTTGTIRNSTYPLSRSLYIYEISGSRKPNASEAKLLDFVLDRSQMDPIVQAHDFITLK